MTARVSPLPKPWSDADAESIGSWGHPDRTYEPLLLVRCLQRHPTLAARLRTMGEALYLDAIHMNFGNASANYQGDGGGSAMS